MPKSKKPASRNFSGSLQYKRPAPYGTDRVYTPMNQGSYPAEIFPYVGITQIRYDRSKFDYFLSACSTSSLLYLSISLEDGICQAISISFKVPPAYSNILPSVEMVTTRQGINLPLICKAFFTACSIPPQQGTSIRTTVTLLMLLFAKISVSFSL